MNDRNLKPKLFHANSYDSSSVALRANKTIINTFRRFTNSSFFKKTQRNLEKTQKIAKPQKKNFQTNLQIHSAVANYAPI